MSAQRPGMHQSSGTRLEAFVFNRASRNAKATHDFATDTTSIKIEHRPFIKRSESQSGGNSSNGANNASSDVVPRSANANVVKRETDLQKVVVEFTTKYKDCILGFDQGGKYKFFGDHARRVRAICHCEIYAPGSKDTRERFPRVDDPYAYVVIHATEIYSKVAMLTGNGLKVGLVDLIEDNDAVKSKNSIKARKLTKLFTEGTLVGDEFSRASKCGKYILCISQSTSRGIIGVAAIDLQSPEVTVERFSLESPSYMRDFESMLVFLRPVEIVIASELSALLNHVLKDYISRNEYTRVTEMPTRNEEDFSQDVIINELATELGADCSELIDRIIDLDAAIQACVYSLYQYLQDFELGGFFDRYISFKDYFSSIYMNIDMSSLAQVGLLSENGLHDDGSLFSLLNFCETNGGEALLRKWLSRPLRSQKLINQRSYALGDLPVTYGNSSFVGFLQRAKDIDSVLQNIRYRRVQGPRRIISFLQNVKEAAKYTNFWGNPTNFKSQLLSDQFLALNAASETCDKLLRYINIGKTSYSELFNENYLHYEEIENAMFTNSIDEQILLEYLRNLIDETALDVKYGDFNQEPYYLKTPANNKNRMPDDWIILRSSKSHYVLTNPDLERLREKYKYSKQMLENTGRNVYRRFLDDLNKHYGKFRCVCDAISTIDCLISLKKAAIKHHYVRPIFEEDTGQLLEIHQAWNPVVKNALGPSVRGFVNHDVLLNSKEGRVQIITGPNMGGKSTYVREVALLVIMAQIGSYVPAKHVRMSIFDNVFVRMGARDSIIERRSTFMVEMTECNYILQNATNESLIILDEAGRGTSTCDGKIIAESIISYCLTDISCLTIFITHFPEIPALELKHPKVIVNYHVGYERKRTIACSYDDGNGSYDASVLPYKIYPTFELRRGAVKNSFGVLLAESAGVAVDIVSVAARKATELETKSKELLRFRQSLQLLKYLKSGDTADSRKLIKVLDTVGFG